MSWARSDFGSVRFEVKCSLSISNIILSLSSEILELILKKPAFGEGGGEGDLLLHRAEVVEGDGAGGDFGVGIVELDELIGPLGDRFAGVGGGEGLDGGAE